MTTCSPAEGASLLAPQTAPRDGDDGEAPWHDQTLPIAERMKLAEGRPLPRRMMAAMAQQDCGQCGYLCDTYADAIASGAEKRAQSLRARRQGNRADAEGAGGGAGGAPAAADAAARAAAAAAAAVGFAARRVTLRRRRIFISRRRLNASASEKETHQSSSTCRAAASATSPAMRSVSSRTTRALVKAIARLLGIPLEPISAEGQTRSLGDWLTHVKALSPAPDALFALLASVAVDAKEKQRLERMAEGEGADGYDVLADFHAFPAPRAADRQAHRGVGAAAAAPLLDLVLARANPGRVSLTVDVVRYQVDDRLRFGVASTFLGERVQEGDPGASMCRRRTASRCPRILQRPSSWSDRARASRHSGRSCRIAW